MPPPPKRKKIVVNVEKAAELWLTSHGGSLHFLLFTFSLTPEAPTAPCILCLICATAGRMRSIAAAVLTVHWAEGDVNYTLSHRHQVTDAPRNAPQEIFVGRPYDPRSGSSQTAKNNPSIHPSSVLALSTLG